MRCCFQRAQQSRQHDSATASATANWSERESLHEPDHSTSALIESILPLFLPLACQIASKTLISNRCIKKNEILVTTFDENAPTKELPIETIDVSIGDVLVIDRETLQKDMEKDPDFEWPEKRKINLLMDSIMGKKEQSLLVIDIVDLNCFIQLGNGIEITFPSNIPLVGNLEIGSGGDVEKGSVKVSSGRLRVWFSNETKKCYIALMERPLLTPLLHVNADKGNGDNLNIYLKEDGSLDDVVETIMAGYGPKDKLGDKKDGISNISSMIGNALGKFVSSIIGSRNSGPLEVDLSMQIKASIDAALGKTRPVEQIQADIERLQKELEIATQKSKVNTKSSDADPRELREVARKPADINEGAGSESNGSVSLKGYVVSSMAGVQNTLISCANPPITDATI